MDSGKKGDQDGFLDAEVLISNKQENGYVNCNGESSKRGVSYSLEVDKESHFSGHFRRSIGSPTGGSILEVLDNLIKKAKKDCVKEICNKNKVNFLSLQETKMEKIDHFGIKHCWGNYSFEHVCGPSMGNSGGILCVGDSRMFRKHNATILDYFVAIQGDWISNAKKHLIISVYAPQEISEKRMLWSYLNHMIHSWSGESIIIRDFNEVRTKEERFGTIFNNHNARVFNSFISSSGLLEVPLGGCEFTCDTTGNKKHDEKAKRDDKEKSHVDSPTGVRDLRPEFEEFSFNSTNRVNAVNASINAAGLNLTNITNSFNTASPSNNVVSLNFRIAKKSSFIDPSKYLDDPDTPELEDIVYLDDEENVGVEADLSNLETNIPVSPIQTTRVHQDYHVNQIIGELTLAPQTRSMTRMNPRKYTKDSKIQVELKPYKRSFYYLNYKSCFMASAVICLATCRKFNFSKYIFDSMVRNVDYPSKFLMYPCLQVVIDNQVDDMTTHNTRYTSLALTQKPQVEEEVEVPIAPALSPPAFQDPTPTPYATPPQVQSFTPYASPPQEQPTIPYESSMPLLTTSMETYATLSQKVLRKIEAINVDEGITLVDVEKDEEIVDIDVVPRESLNQEDVSAVEPTVFDDEERYSYEDLHGGQQTKEQKFGYILQVIKMLKLKKLDVQLAKDNAVQRLKENAQRDYNCWFNITAAGSKLMLLDKVDDAAEVLKNLLLSH
nr:RNA-directed DNA polymerase, eukaryota [Tanacetum cinerariifolium]